MSERFTIGAGEAGRVDKAIAARFPGLGRRALARLFARKAVRVNGRVARKGDRVAVGAEITLDETPRADFAPVPEGDLDVLYEDADIVVMNKPAGMPSHPLHAGELRTLGNAIMARFPECARAGEQRREAGLVHRLDTGTTGAIMAARNPETWRALRAAFTRGRVDKRYLALVRSADIGDGECSEPLVHRGNRMIVARSHHERPLAAVTSWRVLERLGTYTLLECTARTGRMHQVRVHLAHAGAAIVGDALYGGPAWPEPMTGHFLHASGLAFEHPTTQARMDIEAPLPGDRQAILDELRMDTL